MLLFIRNLCRHGKTDLQFQNIVCYCLSLSPVLFSVITNHFKTSYVTVYRRFRKSRKKTHCYFKTSYVTVYPTGYSVDIAINQFQNIVCYCLSKKMHMKMAFTPNFKTSYVTVYQSTVQILYGNFLFQNIVCYCLSGIALLPHQWFLISKHRMLLFIWFQIGIQVYQV